MVHILLIGLTGTIGSGKSTVAKLLKGMGVKVIELDKIGHKILDRDNIKDKLVEEFGSEIIDPNRNISRKMLAAKAFKDSRSAKILNEITHPEIEKELASTIEKEKKKGTSYLVIESPLLFETGSERLFDMIIMVTAEKELRIERIKERGWQEDELKKRERFFLDEEEKLKIADIVIENNGSVEELERKVKKLWNYITSQKGLSHKAEQSS